MIVFSKLTAKILPIQFTAKFVVSRCSYCKLRRNFGFFYSVNHFSEGGVNGNHNVTYSPGLAEDDSGLPRIAKEADVALFVQVTRMRKIRKTYEANLTSRLLPKQDDHKATNLETRNKQNRSKSTNHESQTMTF